MGCPVMIEITLQLQAPFFKDSWIKMVFSHVIGSLKKDMSSLDAPAISTANGLLCSFKDLLKDR